MQKESLTNQFISKIIELLLTFKTFLNLKLIIRNLLLSFCLLISIIYL